MISMVAHLPKVQHEHHGRERIEELWLSEAVAADWPSKLKKLDGLLQRIHRYNKAAEKWTVKLDGAPVFGDYGRRWDVLLIREMSRVDSPVTKTLWQKLCASPRGVLQAARVAQVQQLIGDKGSRKFKDTKSSPQRSVEWMWVSVALDDGEPLAFWLLELELSVPKRKSWTDEADAAWVSLSPTLKVSLLQRIELLLPEEADMSARLATALRKAVAQAAFDVIESLGWSGRDDDEHLAWVPLSLVLRCPAEDVVATELLRELAIPLAECINFESTEGLTGLVPGMEWNDDIGRGPYLIGRAHFETATAAELVPTAPVQASPQPKGDAGHTAILLEKVESGYWLTPKGKVLSQEKLDQTHEFREEFGMSPSSFRDQCGMNTAEFKAVVAKHPEDFFSALEEWVKSDLFQDWSEELQQWDADDSPVFDEGDWVDVMMQACQTMDLQQPGRELTMRILVDSSTNVAYAEFEMPQSSITDFLDRALKGGVSSPLSIVPKQLQLGRGLLKTHPSVVGWCDTRSVAVVHPSSGFKNAAHVMAQWLGDLRHLAPDVEITSDEDGAPRNRLCTFKQANEWLRRHAWMLGTQFLEESSQRYRALDRGIWLKGHYSGSTVVNAPKYFNDLGLGSYIEAAQRALRKAPTY